MDSGDGTEHIGKGTIPALFKSFHCDDEVDLAIGRKQVDPVEFFLVTRYYGNLFRGVSFPAPQGGSAKFLLLLPYPFLRPEKE